MRNKLAIFVAGMVLATSAPSSAQSAGTQSPLISALIQCKAQTDGPARLRCYDAAAAALAEANGKGEIIVVNREDVRKTRRSLFGFNLPKLPFFSGDKSGAEEFDEIELGIVSARMLDDGKHVLHFDDGSVWQTTEVKWIRPKAGEKATIKKAALGSYFLRIDGRSVRGMRVK